MSAVEFLLFSDFHGHNFRYGAKRVPVDGWRGLYNSRLVDSLYVLDEIRFYALDNNIRYILFGGDLFHSRSSVSTDVFNLVSDRLLRMAVDGLELHLLVGNHDMADRLGHVHSLEALGHMHEDIWVHDTVEDVDLGKDASLVTVPYTDDVQEARARLQKARELSEGPSKSLLLAHLGMQGAKVGSDYVLVSDGDVTSKDVPDESFAACFFGHFHEHQQLFRNGWFIGATHEHNWGDSGGQRGFLHAKLDNGKVSFKRIETQAPRFVYVLDDSHVHLARENDFVRSTEGQADKVTATHIEVIGADDVEEDLDLSLDRLDLMSTLEAWVDAKDPPRKEQTLALGKQLLAQAITGDM